jgi:hypothetical protein
MSSTIQKSFRLPIDVIGVLDKQENATEFVVEAIREKQRRDEEELFRSSARRIASLTESGGGEVDAEWAMAAQVEILGESSVER